MRAGIIDGGVLHPVQQTSNEGRAAASAIECGLAPPLEGASLDHAHEGHRDLLRAGPWQVRLGRRTFAAQILTQPRNLLGAWRQRQWIADFLQGLRGALEDPRELAGRIPHEVRRLRRGWYEGAGEAGSGG